LHLRDDGTGQGKKETMVAEYQGLLLALTNHHEEQIVITLDDGSERHFDYCWKTS
jgi:hypothetical protein